MSDQISPPTVVSQQPGGPPSTPAPSMPQVQPGYAPPPGWTPPGGGPPPPAGDSFKAGKGTVIGLIVGAVVAVGGIGGIVAAVSGGDDEPSATRDDRPGVASGAVAGGTPAPAQPGNGILDPEPVGTASALPDPSVPAEPDPTVPAPDPAPDPVPEPAPLPDPAAGDSVVLSSTGLQVPVPGEWEVLGDVDDDEAVLVSPDLTYVQAITGRTDPSSTAISVINGQLDRVLPESHYSGLTFGDPLTLAPFGSLVSFAGLPYDGTWVDSQGTFPVAGTIFCAVRQDGTVLIMTPEQKSRQQLVDQADDWSLVVDGAFNLMGAN